MPRRLISAATSVLLVFATLFFAALVVGAEPAIPTTSPRPHPHPSH